MAQRYTVTGTHAFPTDDGQWVMAKDHAAEVSKLCEEIKELKARLEQERKHHRSFRESLKIALLLSDHTY